MLIRRHEINEIQKYFGFNLLELAKIIGIDRKDLYDLWQQEKPPSLIKNRAKFFDVTLKIKNKIDQIYPFVESWIKAGRKNIHIHQTTPRYSLLIHYLMHDKIDKEALSKTLDLSYEIELAIKVDRVCKKLKKRQKNKRKNK